MKFVQYVSIVVGVGSLARGYQAGGHAVSANWLLVLGLVWLFAETQRWRWFASLGFLACVAAAGYGLWLNLPSGWMLAGAMGALVAWDLSDFLHRLKSAAPEDEVSALTRRHLIRLAIVTAAGLVFSLVGMFVRLRLSFEWAAFLAILSALGVSLLVKRVRNQ
jgi:hypothetical protein